MASESQAREGSSATASVPMSLYPAQDMVSPFLKNKYEREAGRYWNMFYQRNQKNFFKDRHYLEREFSVLNEGHNSGDGRSGGRMLLEIGCGVGNTVFPLVEGHGDLKVHCCDFSKEAVRLVKAHEKYDEARINAFVCDVTSDDLLDNVPAGSVDITTLIFVISAIPPEKLEQSIANIAKTLRPGAHVLVRDYGTGDLAEERLDKKKATRKLGENYYVRGDGTFCVYFSEESLTRAFESAGFKTVSMKTCKREIENRRQQVTMKRNWVQAVFQYVGTEEEAVVEYEWHREHESSAAIFLDGAEERNTHEEEVTVCKNLDRVSLVSISKEHMHSVHSTGLMLWDGAKALSEIISSCADDFKGKNVIELGCGCSPLSAIALSASGAASVAATDGNPEALKMLQDNLDMNSAKFDFMSSLSVRRLRWDSGEDLGGFSGKRYDAIVASDVLYIEEAIPALFQAAARLLAEEGYFLICYTPRRAIEEKALLYAEKAGLKSTEVLPSFQQQLERQGRKSTMRLLQFVSGAKH
ncbi:S-adenosyl-L-methionine-dependent methyltransferase [Chloropicon primus]|uniref:S-adenosyl-L-methionine-dependent methyltransferase n=1 Tax=Chloropicon primus TaxID=1764295 RepID=A0A5B8MIN6_9CHLO|nr:S-adenosyl-L-methionine-dependent methyltransferase [Chloropicon primus]UPQ99145.1 S-adenosyl-L-methionine-dependent methyltransferase [Chloropicon primus]|eukprot:QDZ19934.1 S-adenosyl-L-methionine-dependent methyltransferase [Chloropicon primus]